MAIFKPNPTKIINNSFGLTVFSSTTTESTVPVALVEAQIEELTTTDNIIKQQTDALNLTTGDTVDFYQINLANNGQGGGAWSAPSPVYSHTVVGATVNGFSIKWNTTVGVSMDTGIIGKAILMKTPDMDAPRLAAWGVKYANELVIYEKPLSSAQDLQSFTNMYSQTVYQVNEISVPMLIQSPTEEIGTDQVDLMIHKQANVTYSSNYKVKYNAEIPNASPEFKTYLQGINSNVYLDSQGRKQTFMGQKGNECYQNYWVATIKGSDSCAGRSMYSLMKATLSTADITINYDTANTPVTITQQLELPLVGSFSVSMIEA